MRRTLLAIGFAVLMSMMLAPHGNKGGVKGWGLFFSDYGLHVDTNWGDVRTAQFGYGVIGRVMIDMLAVQTMFLAVLFAVIANIRWRPSRRVVIWSTLCATLLLIVGFGLPAFQQQMKAGAEREEWTASRDINNGNLDSAKEHLLKAANYWWWKGWWDGARNASERALDQQGMERHAAAFRAEQNETRARQLLRKPDIFDQFGPWRAYQSGYPDDESITKAKRLLLDATEQWHIAGNAGSEERVRTWEKNVKTKAELLASLPGFTWADESPKAPPDQPGDASASNDTTTRFDPSKPYEVESIPPWSKYTSSRANPQFDPDANLAGKENEKLIHDPIDYQLGQWTTNRGKAFAVAKFFERNLGDRKGDLDALADQLGAQKRYMLIEKQQRGGVWWVRVFLYRQ